MTRKQVKNISASVREEELKSPYKYKKAVQSNKKFFTKLEFYSIIVNND